MVAYPECLSILEKDSPDGEMKSLVERPVLGRSDHWK